VKSSKMAVVFGECGRECLSGPGNTGKFSVKTPVIAALARKQRKPASPKTCTLGIIAQRGLFLLTAQKILQTFAVISLIYVSSAGFCWYTVQYSVSLRSPHTGRRKISEHLPHTNEQVPLTLELKQTVYHQQICIVMCSC
jgi:hypothetical protein